jgi:mono/diheme cytochrome c family protein
VTFQPASSGPDSPPTRSASAVRRARTRVLLLILAAAGLLAAQPAMRSTQDGVYTEAQASQGKDLFAMACQNCHTLLAHTGPPFRNKWFGRSLGDLFEYLQNEMPKADPGSLSNEEYLVSVAYLMKINGMPAGSTPLAADAKVLHRIRIDSVRPAPTSTGPR